MQPPSIPTTQPAIPAFQPQQQPVQPVQTELTQEEIYQMVNVCIEQEFIPSTLLDVQNGALNMFGRQISENTALDVITRIKASTQPQQSAQQPVAPVPPTPVTTVVTPFQQPVPPVAQPPMATPPIPGQTMSVPPIPGVSVAIPPIPSALAQAPEPEKEDFKAKVIGLIQSGQIPPKWENIEQYYKSYDKRCGEKTAKKVLVESGVAPAPIPQPATQPFPTPSIPSQELQPKPQHVLNQPISNPQAPGGSLFTVLYIDCLQSHPAVATLQANHVLLPLIQHIEQTGQYADYRQVEHKKGIMEVCNLLKANPGILPQEMAVRTSTLPRDVVSTLRTMFDVVIDKVV